LSQLFGDDLDTQISSNRYYVNTGAFQFVESFAQIVPDSA
jgi:hypothetical protein